MNAVRVGVRVRVACIQTEKPSQGYKTKTVVTTNPLSHITVAVAIKHA